MVNCWLDYELLSAVIQTPERVREPSPAAPEPASQEERHHGDTGKQPAITWVAMVTVMRFRGVLHVYTYYCTSMFYFDAICKDTCSEQ